MADLASLGIVVKTTGVKEATRELDGLTREGKEAEKQADRVSKNWKAAGKALGAGIAAGVAVAGVAFKKYLDNTIEAERVQAQLAARIKSTGGAARLSLIDLNKMAEALQFKTSFDDESIGEVQALLLTFTKIGRETFPQATEAVLDLSTAMGTDLNSAALQLGKALNDPVKGITALSRAGVQFSESQKALIKDLVKTGDVAGAQAVILKELQTQMGGAAVAARNTLGGALKALENSFNNLLEGNSGDAGVKGARDAIEDLNRTLNDPAVKKGFADMVAGLASIASAAASAIGPLMDLIKVQRESFGFSQKLAGNGRRAPEARDSVQGLAASNAALLRGDLRTFAVARARALQAELGIGQVADFSGVSATTSGRAGRARNPRGGSNRPEAFVPIEAEAKKKKVKIDHSAERELRQQEAAALRFTQSIADLQGELDGPLKAAELDHIDRKREINKFAKEGSIASSDLTKALALEDEVYKKNSETIKNSLLQQAAAYAGPLQAAEQQHLQNLRDIDEVAKQLGLTTAEIAQLKKREADEYAKETKAIDKQIKPYQELLRQKQFDLDLMGMSNVERQTAIDLHDRVIAATEEEAAAIRDLNQAYEDRSRTIDLMDDFRRSASDNLSDFIKGTKSAKEAALDFLGSVADMLIEMAAKQLVAKAFGEQGSTGGGTGGGGWLSAIMGLFGSMGSSSAPSGGWSNLSASDFGAAGWKDGGWTGNGPRNKAAGIVHGQEGVLNADAMRNVGITNLQRLNAGAKLSQVAPANSANGDTYNISIPVQGNIDRRTKGQVANETARQVRIASRNN